MKKTEDIFELTRTEKVRGKPHPKRMTLKSGGFLWEKTELRYDNNCKDSRTCILGKICTVVVRNERKLQSHFGLLDIFLELTYCLY